MQHLTIDELKTSMIDLNWEHPKPMGMEEDQSSS
jgi:hypothetical protein